MNYAQYIREIGRGAQGSRDLSADDARQLYLAMLDGGVPDLELGAIILGLRVKGESLAEMLGFLAATEERVQAMHPPPGRVRPIVLPTYNGARKEVNLTPLLAIMLQRFGVPVLVHGLIEGYGRVTTGQVFRELGIMPSVSVTQASRRVGLNQARPLLLGNMRATLIKLLAERTPVYQNLATITVDTDRTGVRAIVDQIISELKEVDE